MLRSTGFGGALLLVLSQAFSGVNGVAAAPPAAIAAQIVEPGPSFQSWGFRPDPLIVSVGDTITWTNTGLAAHTVTSDDGKSFSSGTVAAGGAFRFTAASAGTFKYHCVIHQSMEATLVVNAAAAASATIEPIATATTAAVATETTVPAATASIAAPTSVAISSAPATATVAPTAATATPVATAVPSTEEGPLLPILAGGGALAAFGGLLRLKRRRDSGAS